MFSKQSIKINANALSKYIALFYSFHTSPVYCLGNVRLYKPACVMAKYTVRDQIKIRAVVLESTMFVELCLSEYFITLRSLCTLDTHVSYNM